MLGEVHPPKKGGAGGDKNMTYYEVVYTTPQTSATKAVFTNQLVSRGRTIVIFRYAD
jgi:hypothetical protein